MKQKIIITADDFGISPLIDDAILEAVRAGVVTSVAVLPNGNTEGWERIKKLNRDFGNKISIGLHFNITNGPAVSGPSSLTKSNGQFKGVFKQNLLKINPDDLTRELTAQIAKFTQHNIEISHFSDHFGILTSLYDDILEITLHVIKTYQSQINKKVPIRNPMLSSIAFRSGCLSRGTMEKEGRLGLVLKSLAFREKIFRVFRNEFNRAGLNNNLRIIRDAEVPFADFFIDKLYKAKDLPAALDCIIQNLPDSRYKVSCPLSDHYLTCELLTHPARKGSSDEYRQAKLFGFMKNYLKKGRTNEHSLLLAKKDFLQNLPNNILLGSYPT